MNQPARSGLLGKSKMIGLGVMLGLLLVFSTVVVLVTFSVRNDIRLQMLDVDSHVLNLLVRNEIEQAEADAELVFEFESLGEVELWSALLETATLDGVFAVQYFDEAGELRQSSSELLVGHSVAESITHGLEEEGRHTVFSDELWLSDFADVDFSSDRRVAVSDIYLSLVSSDGNTDYGTARYLMDGSALAKQFSMLDLQLVRQASIAVGIGGALVLLIFWVAWKRLSEANARVLRHADRLTKANSELAMLARTSAVGSVTAHLIHGLKNPLAGLREVVSAGRSGEVELDEEEWKGASEAADRMQRMVQEVIGVLQDSSTGLSYEMESGELFRVLESRFTRVAEEQGIVFSVSGEGGVKMDSRVSNIVTLIVSNLVQNAIEATPESGRVGVTFSCAGPNASVRVEDSGKGVPEEMKGQLFSPVTSGKSGGAGIGLTISSQLAKHLGGSLRLLDTGEGAVFELEFPTEESFLEGVD
ncbi:sensor histidine kinase [Pelagicoccus mobilis]|uniref:histidine kinase n=1 Tax=Pelagicoccus mobilis TaxID=415221 RepID=A0A934S127_9BACT|nr:HAMP domain-containing sensor histidine kinase [Pelagicoccus mobilis]MBK1877917.1 HAMP domain-containing histidine kinase [Pelagicoccus mobilis]